MKKYLTASFVYLLSGLAAGVYFREFSKGYAYTGTSALSVVHPHLLVLGCLFFLLLYFTRPFAADAGKKKVKLFFILYNVALPLTAAMMLLRGSFQVAGVSLSKALDGLISGVAGLAHIALAVAFILFFIALFEQAKKSPAKP